MDAGILTGKLVRLTCEDPQVMAKCFEHWQKDSLYMRLLSTDPSMFFSSKYIQELLEKDLVAEQPRFTMFAVRRLADDQTIGEIGLDAVDFPKQDTFVGIGIGEREDWNHGYGTDAMRVLLRYAFTELNLHRVSLTVFEYNPRAIQSYLRAGFREEGRLRQCFKREGQRWDMIFMGILRSEWEQMHGIMS